MKSRLLPLLGLILLLTLPLLLVPACSNDDSTNPGGGDQRRLAGGGREQGDDPFAGGPDGSGPTNPGFDYPDPGYMPLFYSDVDCQDSPATTVIGDQQNWETWWTAATECLGSTYPGDPTDPATGRRIRGRLQPSRPSAGFAWDDSGHVEPDTLFPYPGDPPVVDFEKNAVVTISLAPEPGIGRGVWVTEVNNSETGTLVRYQVSRLGDDCFAYPESVVIAPTSTPTIAVQIPRPVTEPISWEREDLVFDCSWEPDPATPITLYYTDAECNLGSGEVVIRDSDRFEAWLKEALECDQARWYAVDSTVTPDGTGPRGGVRFRGGDRDSVPVDPPPPPPPPTWIGIDVDFTTHAVLILRGETQTRWGGGVWLDAINVTPGGTVIDYTVMEPSGECPEVEGDWNLQPTAAIRVPLPLTEPVTWNRRTESINCGWAEGDPSTGTGSGPRAP